MNHNTVCTRRCRLVSNTQPYMTGVPLPIPRSEIAAALNEKIYIIGDFDEGHNTIM